MLKPALSRGEIQCIGATTLDEYRKYIEKNGALERRFQSIIVDPPSLEESIEILKGLKDRYETHHRLRIPDSSIEQAVKLSARYVTDRYLPDKAIDVMDEAGARVRLQRITPPPMVRELQRKINDVVRVKKDKIENQEFEKAVELRDELRVAPPARLPLESFGIREVGSTQHAPSSGGGCARVARRCTRLRSCESAASGLSIMYAGNRGRTERRSSNHRPPLFGASAGSRTSLFGDASR
jgi:ATP-dependent Clp protease ATP-binding subunit ClpA